MKDKTKEELLEEFNLAMDYGDFYLASEIKEELDKLEQSKQE